METKKFILKNYSIFYRTTYAVQWAAFVLAILFGALGWWALMSISLVGSFACHFLTAMYSGIAKESFRATVDQDPLRFLSGCRKRNLRRMPKYSHSYKKAFTKQVK